MAVSNCEQLFFIFLNIFINSYYMFLKTLNSRNYIHSKMHWIHTTVKSLCLNTYSTGRYCEIFVSYLRQYAQICLFAHTYALQYAFLYNYVPCAGSTTTTQLVKKLCGTNPQAGWEARKAIFWCWVKRFGFNPFAPPLPKFKWKQHVFRSCPIYRLGLRWRKNWF